MLRHYFTSLVSPIFAFVVYAVQEAFVSNARNGYTISTHEQL